MLDVHPFSLESMLLNVVSMTTDLGVEVAIPGFRAAPQDLLPPWRAQVAQVLQPDGNSVATLPDVVLDAPVRDLALDVDPDGDACLDTRNLTLDCDSDMGDAEPSGGSAPPETTAEATGDVLMSTGWQENLAWQGRFLPFAIPIPGMLHVCNNLLTDIDTSMSYWPWFWPLLTNVAALLSDQMRLDRFRFTCVDRSQFATLADKHFLNKK